MQTGASNSLPANGKRDLYFHCEHCNTPLVVDCAAAGMTLNCQRCGKPTVAPTVTPAHDNGPSRASNSSEQLAELKRHLKENESQRTEVGGYINQLSIQLHRWQLRLQTLNERNNELTKEIGRLEGESKPSVTG